MRPRVAIVTVLLVACGPKAEQVPEIQPWMSGIWSQALMTESKMNHGPDGGLGEGNDSQPARWEIFADGRYEAFSSVTPGIFETFESTWQIVDEDEIRADRHDNSPDSTMGYRWEFGTGERGCDTILVTHLDGNEDRSVNLYRGAICTVQQEPCPPDAVPPHNCFYYHYTWCQDQGENESWNEPCREDCYCHLPGYEQDE